MLRVPYPPSDGGSAVMLQTVKALRDAGHPVHIAALNTDKHRCPPELLPHVAPISAVEIQTPVRAGDALFNMLFSRLPYNVSRFLSEEFARMAADMAKKNDYDIVQFEGTYTALYADAIRRKTKAPFVLRAHNVENQIWRRMAQATRHPLKKLYFYHLARRIRRFEAEHLRCFDGIVAITPEDEREFLRMGFAGPTTVVPAAVDLVRFSRQMPAPDSENVAFLGSLDWLPNIEGLEWFVSKVWPAVISKRPSARFFVAGRNPVPGLDSRLAAPGVVFYGPVPDAPSFLERFNITVVPLLSGGGMRVKIVEQMALGKCVVTTSVGAEGVYCRTNEHIVLADDPETFAQKILELFESPQLVKIIGENAANTAAENYDVRLLAKRYEEFYARLYPCF
jgi:glycosyltransferase involved in cell wall biosynthesis